MEVMEDPREVAMASMSVVGKDWFCSLDFSLERKFLSSSSLPLLFSQMTMVAVENVEYASDARRLAAVVDLAPPPRRGLLLHEDRDEDWDGHRVVVVAVLPL